MKGGLIAAFVALPLLLVILVIPMMANNEEDCAPTPVPPGGGLPGEILIANANIKVRSGFDPGVAALTREGPDFITLNEVGDVPTRQLESVRGYDAYRHPKVDRSADGGRRSMDNAIMWRPDRWKMLTGGREKIVNRDHTIFNGRKRLWGKWAAWGVFERKSDGATVSVISVHHMTNPIRQPRQWGNPPMSRKEQYLLGMQRLQTLMAGLAAQGPVLVGGDFNSRKDIPRDRLAIKSMARIGYQYTKDNGVIYQFYAPPATVRETWQISARAVHSDHPALFTRLAMNAGAEPAPQPGTANPVASPSWPSGVEPGSDEAIRATYQVLLDVGFSPADAHLMTVIAGGESTWDPSARNSSSTATGLFQVLQSHDWEADLTDPVVNAQWAKRLFDASGNADPWQAWPESPLANPPHVDAAKRQDIIENFNRNEARVEKVLGASPEGPGGDGCPPGGPEGTDPPGGVSGPRLQRLRQRADMVIALAERYPGGPGCVPGYNDQGVFSCGSGWASACTAISMMIYGQNYVGSGSGGERAFGSEVQGRQGSSWPPPPGAIVSWPYDGNGHVSIYLGDGKWVDNWPDVGYQDHSQVEQGARAHWLLPPAGWEGDFLNDGLPNLTQESR